MKDRQTRNRRILIAIIPFTLILSAASFLPSTAAGAEPALILTLAEALDMAREKHKDILKAQEYRRLVEGRYVEERADALPQFLISSSISRSRDESLKAYGADFSSDQRTRAADLGLSQALFTFGKVGAAIRAAKFGIASADEQLRLFRQAALRDTTAIFYDILLAGELRALALQNLEQKNRHFDEVQKKFIMGVVTDYDVLAARVAVDNARPEVIRAENLVRITREKLSFLLGLGGRSIEVRGNLETEAAPYPNFDKTVAVARNNRPDVADMGHRIKMAGELVTIAAAGDKPRLDLKADWGWRDLSLENGQAEGQTWMAGLYLTYPIFDGLRTRGKVSQAKSDMATLKIEEAKLMDTVLLQTREAVDAVREAGEIVEALSATTVQADRLLVMAEKAYELGVKTKLDVDDAALNRTQARGNLARARRDYLVALATMQWVTGTIGEVEKPALMQTNGAAKASLDK